MRIYLLLCILCLSSGTKTKNKTVKLQILNSNNHNNSLINLCCHDNSNNKNNILKKTLFSDYKTIIKESIPYFVLMASYITFWAIILLDSQRKLKDSFIVSF